MRHSSEQCRAGQSQHDELHRQELPAGFAIGKGSDDASRAPAAAAATSNGTDRAAPPQPATVRTGIGDLDSGRYRRSQQCQQSGALGARYCFSRATATKRWRYLRSTEATVSICINRETVWRVARELLTKTCLSLSLSLASLRTKPSHSSAIANSNGTVANGGTTEGGGELYEKFKQQKQNKESDYIMNGNPTIVPPAHMGMNTGGSVPNTAQSNGNGAPPPAPMGPQSSEEMFGNKDFEVSL